MDGPRREGRRPAGSFVDHLTGRNRIFLAVSLPAASLDRYGEGRGLRSDGDEKGNRKGRKSKMRIGLQNVYY